MRLVAVAAVLVALVATANVAYQVIRKPSELLFPIASALDKSPQETWRHYAPLFRAHSTATIAPELLAALVQVESAGNPLAGTYWRWRVGWNPFALYQPASSAVGMYQITDAAFADARRYCVRNHVVVAAECPPAAFYSRLVPSDAVQLASAYLDRNVTIILARLPTARPTMQQKHDLAALVHLCGAGPAEGFARRGFRLASERCGSHDAAAYLARVNAMKRQFLRLAAER